MFCVLQKYPDPCSRRLDTTRAQIVKLYDLFSSSFSWRRPAGGSAPPIPGRPAVPARPMWSPIVSSDVCAVWKGVFCHFCFQIFWVPIRTSLVRPLDIHVTTLLVLQYLGPIHKTCKHKNLPSTEKYCLAEIGYQPRFHSVCIVVAGAQLNFCFAKKFALQRNLHSRISCLTALWNLAQDIMTSWLGFPPSLALLQVQINL